MTDISPSFFQSKLFKGILVAIAAVVILLGVFQLGVMVGHSRSAFSYHWAQNYPNNFFPKPRNDGMRGFDNKDFVKGHGAMGEVIKIDNNLLTVKEKDQVEKVVVLKDSTVIEDGFDVAKGTDLKVGVTILVIGTPNTSGQVEAKIIRLIPPLETSPSPRAIQ
jgi:hypothetical protein